MLNLGIEKLKKFQSQDRDQPELTVDTSLLKEMFYIVEKLLSPSEVSILMVPMFLPGPATGSTGQVMLLHPSKDLQGGPSEQCSLGVIYVCVKQVTGSCTVLLTNINKCHQDLQCSI